MIKWRCCPELVQFYGFRSVEVLLDTLPRSPKNCPEAKGGSVRVQISLSRPEIFGHIGRSPGCDVDTTGPMPYRLDYEDNCVECVLPTAGAKPAHARHVEGDPKDCRLSRGDPKDCGPRSVLTLSPKSGSGTRLGLGVDIKAMRFPLLEARLWQEAKSNLVTSLGKDDRIAWCWTLGPPAGPSRAGRVSGRTGRGRGVNFVTLAGSSLTRHVALPDHGVGLDGQSCSCLIVDWPVGLSSPTLGVGRPSVMFLFDCWPNVGYSEDLDPIIGFHMREVIKGNVTFKIWDASGQSRFRSSWERFVHVGVLLSCCRYVDAADLDNLFISKNELHKLCKTLLNGIPLLVLGNKMDEPGLSLKKP
ncbi:hypothetical protein YC2023_010281 [Brassica napus]